MTPDGLRAPVAFLPQETHGPPGRLGFAPAPGLWRLDASLPPARLLDDDLRTLCACGASVLVTLLEETEMARIGLADLLARAQRAGLETLWFPIADGTAPSDLGSTAGLVDEILERLAAGRTVVVHCHGGIGRSGTVAACCLVALGADPRRAIDAVRKARPGAATAPGQEDFVQAFGGACLSRARAVNEEELP